MAEAGPTQGAERHTDKIGQWKSRRGMARLLRVSILVAPLLSSIGFTWLMGKYLPPEQLGIHRWVWIVSVFVVANLLLFVVGRLTRRLVPLVALMRLTLVFPDNAPSRTKAALRNSNSRTMLREMEEDRAAGGTTGAALHGEYLVQLLKEVNDHDRLTRGHSERVRAYSELLGQELKLSPDDLNKLRWSALLHDVGKLTVPSEVLNKDGRPNDEEWKLLQGHPAASRSYLEPLRPWLGEWLHAADQHHCRWDGNGYPDDLAGTDIAFAGRLVAIADAYDVMTSARSYKKPLSPELARQELTACAGAQFDPQMVRAFLRVGLGRLKTVAGPLAWLANLTGSAQLPIPAATAITNGAWSAGVAAAGLLVVGAPVGEGQAPPEELAFVDIAVEDVDVSTTRDAAVSVTLRAGIDSESAPTFTVGGAAHGSVSSPVGPSRDNDLRGSMWATVVTYRPDGGYVGQDGFGFEVCVEDGVCEVAQVAISVDEANQAPLTEPDEASVTAGQSVSLNVLANDVDPEGGELTLLGVGWASHGSTSVEGDFLVYTAESDHVGDDSFTYSVSDGEGAEAVGVVRIDVLAVAVPPTPRPTTSTTTASPAPTTAAPTTSTSVPPAPNQSPIASDDTASMTEDSSLLIDVLANDRDPEGDALTLNAVGTPIHGSAVIEAGFLRYLPSLDFNGSDQFTYTVTDGVNPSVSATVRVAVLPVNDPPVGSAIDALVGEDASAGQLVLSVIMSDPDGDPLTTSITGGDPSGQFSVAPDGDVTVAAALDYEDVSSFAIELTISDGQQSTIVTSTVTVADVDEPPIATADLTSTNEDSPRSFDLGANDSDPEGQALTWSVPSASSFGGTVSEAGGVMTYSPPPDFVGTDSFSYTVSDPGGGVSLPAVVSIVVASVNDLPVAVADGGVGFSVDEDLVLVTPDVTANDSDVDGSVVAVSAAVDTGPSDGGVVSNGDGTFTYTPDPDFFGSDSFSYTVADDAGGVSLPAVVSIVVASVNDLPIAADDSLGVDHGASATTIDVRLNDFDLEGGALTVVSGDGANGTTVDNGDGTVTYTHDGSQTQADSFNYTVTDPEGGADTATVTVTITPPEDGDAVAAGVDVCPYDFDPGQTDTDGDGTGDACDSTPTALSTANYTDSGQSLDGNNKTFAVAVGDVDGDGDLDTFMANQGDGNALFLNDGSGAFADSGQVLGTPDSDAVALGDIDGDGDLDAVFANKGSGDTVWLNNGSGVFADSGLALGSADGASVSLGDVDGDGDLDVVIANLDAANTVWLNDGAGGFTDSGEALGSGNAAGSVIGDFDGDGDLDLVFANLNVANRLWLNDGSGSFTNSGQNLGSGESQDVVSADLDGDGDLDLVFAEHTDGDHVWLNDGSGNFTITAQTLGHSHSHVGALGDLDGDGDWDLILGDHRGGDSNTVWLNDGAGLFTDSGQTLGTAKTESLAVGDFDGNGTLDFISANDGEPNEVWFN